MELTSQRKDVIAHYKEGILVAITHTNGHTQTYKVEEMGVKDYEEFFETNKQQNQ